MCHRWRQGRKRTGQPGWATAAVGTGGQWTFRGPAGAVRTEHFACGVPCAQALVKGQELSGLLAHPLRQAPLSVHFQDEAWRLGRARRHAPGSPQEVVKPAGTRVPAQARALAVPSCSDWKLQRSLLPVPGPGRVSHTHHLI